MSGYTQLTREQRYQIEALLKARHSQTKIAAVVGVHKSTISRELRRNRGLRGYRPKQAQCLSENRGKKRVQHRVATKTWSDVEKLLRKDWSPEQISGWLATEKALPISHEWIYQYVYKDKRQGGDLYLPFALPEGA